MLSAVKGVEKGEPCTVLATANKLLWEIVPMSLKLLKEELHAIPILNNTPSK